MNFTKIIVFIFLLISIFIIPVNAQIINGDFETGDLTGWNIEYGNVQITSASEEYGDYKCALYGVTYWEGRAIIDQDFCSNEYEFLEFSLFTTYSNNQLWVTIYDYNISSDIYAHNFEFTSGWQDIQVNISQYQNHNLRIRVLCHVTVYLDNVELIEPTTLMEFTNEPIEVTTYAHLECNLDDYWNTHANEHFYLSYDYYYKNISNYTIIDYNELELNSQNTVNFIPTYYPYFNQTGGCEIKASILYTYHDPVYTEEELGGIGYYVSTVLVNSTYEPPEEPEEPEEPEIPDPEPEPEPEPDPPIPPIQPNGTGVNQSINVSWTGEYYNAVNNTFGGLCSPIYNFTNWSLSPIYSLNNSIGEFNYYMNESFTQTAEDSSILYESINIIFGAIHPKIRSVITYYLIWVVLLIVLKKD